MVTQFGNLQDRGSNVAEGSHFCSNLLHFFFICSCSFHEDVADLDRNFEPKAKTVVNRIVHGIRIRSDEIGCDLMTW